MIEAAVAPRGELHGFLREGKANDPALVAVCGNERHSLSTTVISPPNRNAYTALPAGATSRFPRPRADPAPPRPAARPRGSQARVHAILDAYPEGHLAERLSRSLARSAVPGAEAARARYSTPKTLPHARTGGTPTARRLACPARSKPPVVSRHRPGRAPSIRACPRNQRGSSASAPPRSARSVCHQPCGLVRGTQHPRRRRPRCTYGSLRSPSRSPPATNGRPGNSPAANDLFAPLIDISGLPRSQFRPRQTHTFRSGLETSS